jgi:hypothetical protein
MLNFCKEYGGLLADQCLLHNMPMHCCKSATIARHLQFNDYFRICGGKAVDTAISTVRGEDFVLRRKIMRQRYHISKEGTANDLVIREFAVIGKEKKRTPESMPSEDDYVFIYQENYDGDAVVAAISKGKADLIASLRTDNLFPSGLTAEKIADSVIELYHFSEDRSVELSFDDFEQLAHT